MGCGVKIGIARVALIIFNIFFSLSGAALMAVGIWLLVDTSKAKVFDVFSSIGSEGDILKNTAYVLIAVGCFILGVGIFGCFGAIVKSKCLLAVYILLLVLVIVLEICPVVLALVFKDKISITIEAKLESAFREYYNGSSSMAVTFTTALHYVQADLMCCGIAGPSSYTANLQGFNGSYPVSCCVLNRFVDITALVPDDAENYDNCKKQLATDVSPNCVQAYHLGCIKPLNDWITSNTKIPIGVGIGIVCLEIFGFVCAVYMCCGIGKEE